MNLLPRMVEEMETKIVVFKCAFFYDIEIVVLLGQAVEQERVSMEAVGYLM